ncbi:hypothetical protein Micbo1qcDRAFT_209952 [Microdochium bolleyi]|uniref:Uncharacterized protein n=1 Tax=Microdochium bolleyi TaxID=196109 RepID=A0A136IKH4_9PEZI|nr:hypothetical protein Micbo1qcDRAFT_209952 [Microdochium bolleyi]
MPSAMSTTSTTAAAPTTRPMWEQNLRTHTALASLAVKSGNTDELRAFQTAHFAATLLSPDTSVPDTVKTQLGGLQTGTVQDAQTAAGQCKDKVEALKGTNPDPNDWRAKIKAANDEAKKNFSDMIDAAGDKAVDYINTLPPQQQNGAANVYSGGMGFVNNAINAISGFLGSVFDSIKDFLQGIWNKITDVWNNVKDTCLSAAKSIASFFGFGFRAASLVPGANVAAGEVTGYVGQAFWPIELGLDLVKGQLGDIVKAVLRGGLLGVASEHLDIENMPGRDQVIMARVKFGPQGQKKQGIAPNDEVAELRKKWADAVRNFASGQAVAEAHRPTLVGAAATQNEKIGFHHSITETGRENDAWDGDSSAQAARASEGVSGNQTNDDLHHAKKAASQYMLRGDAVSSYVEQSV